VIHLEQPDVSGHPTGRSILRQEAGLNRVTPAAQYMAVGKDPAKAVEAGAPRTWYPATTVVIDPVVVCWGWAT